MAPLSPALSRSVRTLLIVSAIAALAWAIVALITGGIDARIAGLTIRARGVLRPLAIGIGLVAVYAILDRQALVESVRDVPRAAGRIASWFAVMLALVTTIDAVRYGAFVAVGSDSYGYLSEAYGWASGRLPRPEPIPLSLPFPSSDWMQTPLGYWPGAAPHTIVPSYAPGLPLLMALGILAAGPVGPYLVVPLCAGLFVWVTFVLARRMAGPLAGVAAASIAASSPVVLFLSLWPMSDVPAGAAWTAAAAATLASSRRGALLAGFCTAIGILIRPNLVPLALVPLAWIVLRSPSERLRRAVSFCSFVIPAVIGIAALNTRWYGSPLFSGYGDPSVLYSARHVWTNLRQYSAWLWQSQSPGILVAGVSLMVLGRPSPVRGPVMLAWAFCLVTLLCYISYVPWDQWWYLRFLLPGLGAFFALMAVGLCTLDDRIPRPWGRAAALAILRAILWRSLGYTAALGMFGPFKASEHRSADTGAFVARHLPTDAVFFSMQHSGTIRYYGGRHTLRYDLIDRDWAARAPAELERLGLHPYLAIEDGEMAGVQKAFSLPAAQPLPWPTIARMQTHGGITIYDLATHPSSSAVMPIERGVAPPYAAPVQVRIEPRVR